LIPALPSRIIARMRRALAHLASLGLVASVGLTGCDDGVRCDYTGTSTHLTFTGCRDGVVREVDCDTLTCHCRQNGESVRTFKFASWPWADRMAATRMVNDACGWNISRSTLPF
jgi:hypothetical protein